jgi:hypothetical protein
MTRAPLPTSWQRLAAGFAVPLLALVALTALAFPPAAGAQTCPDPLFPPHVFLLMDTSGSMNFSPPCTQAQFDVGACPLLCPTGDCFVPLQGDDPASKFFILKSGLQTALAAESDVHFGFASFNQDALYARAKHWVYQAQANGPSLPGTAIPYPAMGAPEVFGYLWSCDTGNNDNEIGCLPSKPVDLPDTWELTRVRRLPKGGTNFNQTVTFFVRQTPTPLYKVTYTPTGGGALGNSTLQTTVKIDRCANSGCTSINATVQQVVTWSRTAEFLSWDNASTTNTTRTDPEMSFFSQSYAADVTASNTCAGWDPNTDTTADKFNNYTLRWPTDTSDTRGSLFYKGDVIPMDWQQDHNLDIQSRLAPNLAGNPFATPDVSISTYLNNLPMGSDSFLRLKDEAKRPLIASGSTPLGNSMSAFRTWYNSWRTSAQVNDPDWFCRKKVLVLITDGDETCNSDPCTVAGTLWTTDGVQVYVVALGYQPFPGSQVECIAGNGGSVSPLVANTKQELIDSLGAIFAAAKVP